MVGFSGVGFCDVGVAEFVVQSVVGSVVSFVVLSGVSSEMVNEFGISAHRSCFFVLFCSTSSSPTLEEDLSKRIIK